MSASDLPACPSCDFIAGHARYCPVQQLEVAQLTRRQIIDAVFELGERLPSVVDWVIKKTRGGFFELASEGQTNQLGDGT